MPIKELKFISIWLFWRIGKWEFLLCTERGSWRRVLCGDEGGSGSGASDLVRRAQDGGDSDTVIPPR